jgi:2-dehydro-3-deoxyphosphogluconate aldolase / (4S)-4-hydroxy-2-oxoglutarate aldolase
MTESLASTAARTLAAANPRGWLVAPILPVVVIEDVAGALLVAEAFQAGGMNQIEITLRSSAALSAIEAVARDFPTMRIAAGTVLEAAQISRVRDAGANLCVSPGFTPALAQAMQAAAMPWIPGVATAGEVMRACEAGYTLLKFFPAMAAGGPPALQGIASAIKPARNGDLHFIPTGGVGLANLAAWKALDCIAAVGGSWLAREDVVARRDRAAIVKTVRDALAAWQAA